jgi:protein SCO1/2
MNRRNLLAGSAIASLGFLAVRPETILAKTAGAVIDNSKSKPGPRANYFPNYTLLTQDNKPVRFYDDLIKGKIVLINMFYAVCEGICPGITANLAKVQKLLGPRVGRDIFIYSLSIKPEHDTPAVLKEYAEMHGAKAGWLFLTGKPDEMEILRRKLGFVDPDPTVDADKSQHIGVIRYGNETLDKWGACPGMSRPERFVEALGWLDPWATPQKQ